MQLEVGSFIGLTVIKRKISNLVNTTLFWNNLHHAYSTPNSLKVKCIFVKNENVDMKFSAHDAFLE